MVTIVIPARNEKFLSQTVDDIFKKATGEIEVIVILDGYWPDPPLNSYDNLIIFHRGTARGMREATNAVVNIAKGKYLMKVDAHCIFGEGFDEILKADCEKDWLVVPTRYGLDVDKWERKEPSVDYLYLTFPYNADDIYGTGFHGRKWTGKTRGKQGFYQFENERKDVLIDDIMTFQGSCWFMHLEKFFEIGCTDPEHYYFFQEAQELGMKIWLSGGRIIRNKKTWYGHLHKGKKHGRGYRLSKNRMLQAEAFSTDFWMNNRWPQQTRELKWLIDKFDPPGWPEGWENKEYELTHHHP